MDPQLQPDLQRFLSHTDALADALKKYDGPERRPFGGPVSNLALVEQLVPGVTRVELSVRAARAAFEQGLRGQELAALMDGPQVVREVSDKWIAVGNAESGYVMLSREYLLDQFLTARGVMAVLGEKAGAATRGYALAAGWRPAGFDETIYRRQVHEIREAWRRLSIGCEDDDPRLPVVRDLALQFGAHLGNEDRGCIVDRATPVDFSADARFHDIAYKDATPEALHKLDSFVRSLRQRWPASEQRIRLYHGTLDSHRVATQGLLPATAARRTNLQSAMGNVSMSIFPGAAESFASMAYPGRPLAIYAVDLPVTALKADKDQLRNKRHYAGVACGDSLAESLAIGHGAQHKGRIEPEFITYLGSTGAEVRNWAPRLLPALVQVWDEWEAAAGDRQPRMRERA